MSNTFVFEFESGDVKVYAANEREATIHPNVTAKILAGEFILNVQRNPRGRHASEFLRCGCPRFIQRAQGGQTITEDRLNDGSLFCTGCGRPQ